MSKENYGPKFIVSDAHKDTPHPLWRAIKSVIEDGAAETPKDFLQEVQDRVAATLSRMPVANAEIVKSGSAFAYEDAVIFHASPDDDSSKTVLVKKALPGVRYEITDRDKAGAPSSSLDCEPGEQYWYIEAMIVGQGERAAECWIQRGVARAKTAEEAASILCGNHRRWKVQGFRVLRECYIGKEERDAINDFARRMRRSQATHASRFD